MIQFFKDALKIFSSKIYTKNLQITLLEVFQIAVNFFKRTYSAYWLSKSEQLPDSHLIYKAEIIF